MTETIISIIVALASIAAIWFGGRRSGVAAERAKQTEKRLGAVQQAQEVEDEVEGLGSDALRERARRWVRGSASR